MRHVRHIAILCVLVAVAALYSAPALYPARAQQQSQQQSLQIAASLADMSVPFFQTEAKQLQAEADKLGNVKLDIFDAKNQTTQQQTDLSNVVDKKYDGLILSAVNGSSVVGAAQAVIDADIPVVTLTRSVKGIQDIAYVGSDDSKGAEQQALLVIKQFPNGAKIFNIQGTAGASPAIARNKGLHNVLDGKSQYQIVFEKSAQFKRADAKTLVTQALKDTGVVPDVIVTANDEMGIGAVQALTEQSLNDKVLVIAYGASTDLLTAIQNNQILATLDQFPRKQATLALDMLVDFIRNSKRPDKHDSIISSVMITRDNIADSDSYEDYRALQSATPAATGTVGATSAATVVTPAATMATTPAATP